MKPDAAAVVGIYQHRGDHPPSHCIFQGSFQKTWHNVSDWEARYELDFGCKLQEPVQGW
jgi:hypothetical protein